MKTRWKEKYTTVKVKKFTSPTGPTCILPSTILVVFLLFFTDELLGMIAEQTNLYASQTMTIEAYSKWAIVTVEELKAYLGFYILMSLVRMPLMYDYWSTNPIYRYAPIADRITRDRFLDIPQVPTFCGQYINASVRYTHLRQAWENQTSCFTPKQ